MRDTRKYEDLYPEEFDAILGKTPICYWACGPMEYHGLHNTLGIDPAKAYEICLRAASLAGGIVFPLVPFAPGGGYPPGLDRLALRRVAPDHRHTLCTAVETCEQLYRELLESLADRGFLACVAFGGHGPAGALLKKIEKEFGGRMDAMRFAACASTTFIEELVRASGTKLAHAGMWETAMNMGVAPDRADPARARGLYPPGCRRYPDDVLADVQKATPEFGNRLLDVSARAVADLAQGLLAAARAAPARP